jgi:NAD kinase
MGAAGSPPRVVVITRATDYQALLERHGTREQARFFLETRGQDIADVERRHRRFEEVLGEISRAVPMKWRRSRITRADLNRFVFEPEDIVTCVGQDGLVANAAKYLTGQLVVGINPDPERNDGVLVPHRSKDAARLLAAAAEGRVVVEERTMVEARVDDGQTLLAANEIYIGHRTHQSARYRVQWRGQEERHSSSGVVIATGTGATGWARSIVLGRRGDASKLPRPTDPRLAFFVREAFPSISTGTSIMEGAVTVEDRLSVVSEMNEGGTLFGDGIEDDAIDFRWGLRASIGIAKLRLRLVRSATGSP